MRYVLGIGLRAGATAADVHALWGDVAHQHGLRTEDVVEVRTLDRLLSHPALVLVVAENGWRLVGHPPDVLAREWVPTPNADVALAVGTPSVAEAAAAVGGADLVVPKTVGNGVTMAVGALVDLDHHGDVDARGIRLDLAVNVAVPEPPAFVLDAMADALPGVAAYPDSAPTTRAVAAHLGVDPSCVLLTNGAAQAFTLVAYAHAWTCCVVVHPAFTEPEAALRSAGRPVRREILPPPFVLDPAGLHQRHPDADLVVVGNPTNPTSVLHPRGVVRAARPPQGILLVDEAFVDTCADPEQSLVPDAARPGSRTLVTVSWTKTFGLAGIRAGAVVGDTHLVARLRKVQPAWSVSSLALAAVSACCTPEGDAFVAMERTRLLANANAIHARLRASCTGRGAPQAPFVLLGHPHLALARRVLLDEGIALRRGDTFPGLGPTWARMAARDPDVVAPAVERLATLLAEPSTRPDPREEH